METEFTWEKIFSRNRRIAGCCNSSPHLDILGEGSYPHLECLLKNNANELSCCRGRWIC